MHNIVSNKTIFVFKNFLFPISVVKLIEKHKKIFIAEINGNCSLFDLESKNKIYSFADMKMDFLFTVSLFEDTIFIGGDTSKVYALNVNTKLLDLVIEDDIPKHIYSLQSFRPNVNKETILLCSGNVNHPNKVFLFFFPKMFL